jgi:hypothetical protein
MPVTPKKRKAAELELQQEAAAAKKIREVNAANAKTLEERLKAEEGIKQREKEVEELRARVRLIEEEILRQRNQILPVEELKSFLTLYNPKLYDLEGKRIWNAKAKRTEGLTGVPGNEAEVDVLHELVKDTVDILRYTRHSISKALVNKFCPEEFITMILDQDSEKNLWQKANLRKWHLQKKIIKNKFLDKIYPMFRNTLSWNEIPSGEN